MDLPITLYGLIGPFLVWPVELVVPYPFVVEEIYKYLVVVYLLKHQKTSLEGFKLVVTTGILFALSETALYIFKINMYGNSGLIFTRFILTSLLHSFTFVLIYLLSTKKKIKFLGLFGAMLIHFLYNVYI